LAADLSLNLLHAQSYTSSTPISIFNSLGLGDDDAVTSASGCSSTVDELTSNMMNVDVEPLQVVDQLNNLRLDMLASCEKQLMDMQSELLGEVQEQFSGLLLKQNAREEHFALQVGELAQRQAGMMADSADLASSLGVLVKKVLGSEDVVTHNLIPAGSLAVCEFCYVDMQHACWHDCSILCYMCSHDLCMLNIRTGSSPVSLTYGLGGR